MRRPLAVLVAGAALLAIASPAGAGTSGRVDRVLIFSMPQVSWDDLRDLDLPNLEAFFDEAALGDLAVRATPVGLSGRNTLLGDGYVTLGAGTRSIGDGGKTDGDGFGVDEPFSPDLAGEVYQRRTGRAPDGDLVQLAIGEIDDANADLPLDAEPGALGAALGRAGFVRAVIANGDGVEPTGEPPVYRRSAVSGLMDEEGVVQRGRVDDGLLESEQQAPFGLRLDNDAVLDAFEDVWTPKSVVLVEASDLVRADAYRAYATSDQRVILRNQALRRTDALLGELLASVDDGDAVLVVGPTHTSGDPTLTLAALRAPGVEPGLLRSATTRRSGFVQLIDVAPTVLDLVGVERPSSMAGRPFEVGGGKGDSTADRIDSLADADLAARFIGDQTGPVAIAFVVGSGLLALGMVLHLLGRSPVFLTRDRLRYAALALLAAIPSIFLARLFPLHDAGMAAYWVFVVGVALLLPLPYLAFGRRQPLDPLILATGAIVGLLVLDVVAGSRLQINSALGNSPIVAGRFTGFGNLAFGVLASASLVLAVLLAARIGGRRGTWVATACLAGTVVAAGAPFWGSDVGGVLAMGPAFLVTIVLLGGWRFRVRTAALALAATAIAITAFALVDLARDPDQRTHLGRLFETIGDEGWSGFSTVIERKISANVSSLTGSVWTFGLVMALAFVVFVAFRATPQIRSLASRFPQLRAGAIGAAVLLVLGFALNDSGIRVPALMLMVFDAAITVLVLLGEQQEARRQLARTAVARDEPALAQT